VDLVSVIFRTTTVFWEGIRRPEDTLAEHFGGRPMTEKNLSEWKQGGFKDCQRQQESRAMARDFLEEADHQE
jgi:hypothetical protein